MPAEVTFKLRDGVLAIARVSVELVYSNRLPGEAVVADNSTGRQRDLESLLGGAMTSGAMKFLNAELVDAVPSVATEDLRRPEDRRG